jgi:hypothetical protein
VADAPASPASTAEADGDQHAAVARSGLGGPDPAAPTARWNLRWELLAFLELLGACGLAVAQPLLDVTGRSPDFFLFNSADTGDFVLLLVAATLPLPLALWALGAATGVAGRKTREITHSVLVAAVLVVLAIVVGKHLTPLRGLRLTAVALLVGAVLGVVNTRTEFLPKMLRLLSAAPALFVALFVLVSPSGTILLHRDAGPATPAASASAAEHPPIVMIVFDEFPLSSLMDGRGDIDAGRYPNFARLAHQSTWFRNATALSGYTPYAVPAMLTGRYPTKAAAPFYAEYPDNLFTLLGGTYELKVQESVTLLCPPRNCPTGPQAEPVGGSTPAVLGGLATLLRTIVSPYDSTADPTAGFREPTARERAAGTGRTIRRTSVPKDFRFDAIGQNQPATFTAFINGLRPSPTPQLHFLHVLLPHVPYRHLASGTRYDIPAAITLGGDAGERQPWWLRLLRERYDAQLSYTDRLIGQAMHQLHKSGLSDKALVVVTADHGVNFARDKYKRDYRGSEADVLWVPLFVKAPGQKAGRVDDRNWEHVDLLPTMAHHAGVEIPWPTDGIDALRQRRDRDDKWFYPRAGKRVTVPGPLNFAAVLRGWPPADHILPELTGRRVRELQVRGGGPVAQVSNLDRFDNLTADASTIPAFVYGLLPPDLPADTRVAVAVNGRIGTVAAAAHRDPDHLWFAGLITNPRLFVPGRNKLELFLVDEGGRGLRQLAVAELDR